MKHFAKCHNTDNSAEGILLNGISRSDISLSTIMLILLGGIPMIDIFF
jgi:hypothetical protein